MMLLLKDMSVARVNSKSITTSRRRRHLQAREDEEVDDDEKLHTLTMHYRRRRARANTYKWEWRNCEEEEKKTKNRGGFIHNNNVPGLFCPTSPLIRQIANRGFNIWKIWCWGEGGRRRGIVWPCGIDERNFTFVVIPSEMHERLVRVHCQQCLTQPCSA